MSTTEHPLTETDAAEMWDTSNELSYWRDWTALERSEMLAALRAAFDAGREHERTATPADPHHDPRPWQDCTEVDVRKGDLVERPYLDIVRFGVAHHQDPDGHWRTKGGILLTCADGCPLRRIPAHTTEKEPPMPETTTSAEPLARTLLGVPEGYGAPHHDAGRIKAGDYVAQLEDKGFVRVRIAHHQDRDGGWWTEMGSPVAWDKLRADRPDAITVWPAPTPPGEEVKMPTTDGAVIIPAEGREFIEQVGDCANYRRLTYDAASGRWIGWDMLNHEAEALSPEYITPGTWQEDRA